MSAVEILHPKDEAEWLGWRGKVITSTEVSSLFGISPWMTKFELWHRKARSLPDDFAENERTIWGKRLQLAIAEGLAKDHGFTVRPMTEFYRDNELRLGASFDYEVTDQNALLETKNVDSLQFRDGWLVGDDGEVEASAQIEIQVQHQLLLSKRDFAYIGALIGGNRTVLLKRLPNPRTLEAIRIVTQAFWKSIDANEPPPPEFPRDASFICSLYQSAQDGKCVDMTNDTELFEWALAYKELGQQCKRLEDTREELRARMLERIGDAEKVLLPNGSISAGMVQGGPVSYERKSFRRCVPYFKRTAQ